MALQGQPAFPGPQTLMKGCFWSEKPWVPFLAVVSTMFSILFCFRQLGHLYTCLRINLNLLYAAYALIFFSFSVSVGWVGVGWGVRGGGSAFLFLAVLFREEEQLRSALSV